ncbi:MAG: hypothetical protein HC794_05325 [Nitrospiraceae bacterium]|nr:hypothetical protein [Nitrospiraceae bacterium]
MSLRLYNTLTQQVEDFVPGEPGKVKMYVCGLTTYDLAHAGHARTNTTFDVLSRFLRARGYDEGPSDTVGGVVDVCFPLFDRFGAIAALNVVCHGMLTEPVMGDLLDHAEGGAANLDEWQRANLREMRRQWVHA